MTLEKIILEKNLDAVLVTNMLNVRYLTNFSGTTGIALIIGEKKYFITDFRYVTQGTEEVASKGFQLVREDKVPLEKVNELLKENDVKRIGIENQSVTLSQFDSFKNTFGDLDYVNLNDQFLKLRAVKTEKEIETIKKSIAIAEEALEETLKIIKPGMSEREVCATLEYHMKKRGADKPSFDIIVASNERSALPHGVASDKKIEKNGFLTIDFGCFYKGYASDITRTFYVGEDPQGKYIEIYNVVKEANELAIKAVRAGISVRELDKIARDFITEKGYGDKFGHGLGHGIGLQIHELPGVSYRAEDVILKENMVITIEPGIYLEGFGGVRIEDDVVVTKDGCKVLTSFTKELLSIG